MFNGSCLYTCIYVLYYNKYVRSIGSKATSICRNGIRASTMTTKICKRFCIFGYTCVSTFQSFYTCYTMCVNGNDIIYMEVLLSIFLFFLAPLRFPFSVFRMPHCGFEPFDHIYTGKTHFDKLATKMSWHHFCFGSSIILLTCMLPVCFTFSTLPFVYTNRIMCIILYTTLHQIRTTTLCLLPLSTYFLDLILWLEKFPFIGCR